jgi:hypothetical protein
MKLGSSSPMWGTEIQKPSLWQVHISSWPVLWNPNGSEYWAPSVHLSDCQFFGHRDLPQLGTTFSRSRSHQHKQYIEETQLDIDSKYLRVLNWKLPDFQWFPWNSSSPFLADSWGASRLRLEPSIKAKGLSWGERASKLKVFPGGSPMKSRPGTFWTNI